MQSRRRDHIAIACAVCALLIASAGAQPAIPPGFEHQGYIEVDGAPFSGTGEFRFALVDGSGNNIWTSDGSELGTANMPASAVSLAVAEGVYSVGLGDGGTTDAFPTGLFANNADLDLRVWFDDGDNGVRQLMPDKPVRAVPFTHHAATAELAVRVPNVIVVDRVDYASPRTHVLRIPPTAFVPNNDSAAFSVTVFDVTTEGNGGLLAPVMLPDGATITEVTAIYEDQDNDSNVEIELRRTDAAGNTEAISEITTADETGVVANSDMNPANNVVDNSTYHYTINSFDDQLDWGPDPNATTRIIAIEITYQIDEAF